MVTISKAGAGTIRTLLENTKNNKYHDFGKSLNCQIKEREKVNEKKQILVN